ncbi:MAG: site-2 protease family protein [Anaerolineales bacterium]
MTSRDDLAYKDHNPAGEEPRGKDTVWRLIEKEGAWWLQALSPVLFLLFFSACCWLALRDAGRALSLGLALVLQMFFHELGHLFVFRQNGIRSRIWWLFPLGAVATPVDREEKRKSDSLPWNAVAWLLQAGILANVAVMVIGSLLRSASGGWPAVFGADLLTAGGVLAISNLIPIGKLDGAMLYTVIFSSLKEKDDLRVARGLAAVLIVAVLAAVVSFAFLGFSDLIIAFFLRTGWFAVFALIAAGIWHRQGLDNPAFAGSAQAMNRRQALVHILFYIALLYISLRLVLGPLWMNL